MNTPAHLLLAAALFARKDRPGTTAAALAGGLAPDLSVYVMVGWERWGNGHSFAQIFQHDYRDPFWQGVFAVDNSIPLWALLTLAGVLLVRRGGSPVLFAFAAAGLVHVLCDLPLHNEDARRQFWPLTDWVFRSPLSYWDHRRHAGLVGPAEAALALTCCALLWRRWRRPPARVALGLAATAELALGLAPAARALAETAAAAPV